MKGFKRPFLLGKGCIATRTGDQYFIRVAGVKTCAVVELFWKVDQPKGAEFAEIWPFVRAEPKSDPWRC